jgi:hypothetical protein
MEEVVRLSDDDPRRQLEVLAEENRQLRLSAIAFGQLAERLNEQLRRLEPARSSLADRRWQLDEMYAALLRESARTPRPR